MYFLLYNPNLKSVFCGRTYKYVSLFFVVFYVFFLLYNPNLKFAKNGFQIRIVQQKIHNIKEKRPFFDVPLKENITELSISHKMNNKN